MSDELAAIYAELPRLECQGKCQESCGPIPFTQIEEQRMVAQRGRSPHSRTPDLTCSELMPTGRCAVYDNRPLICRLWGVAEGMECPWGCKPERYVTKAEARAWLRRITDLSARECATVNASVGADLLADLQKVTAP